MSANKILDATTKVVSLLQALEPEERGRVIQAAFMLLGDALPQGNGGVKPPAGAQGGSPFGAAGGVTASQGEKPYFDAKEPTSKIEELAVAARYRDEVLGMMETTREDFVAIFRAARRNFDSNNYTRDIQNARTRGLFNKGSGANAVLSHYGQNYVDALPDRAAVAALRSPKRGGGKRPAAKKAPKKAAK